MAEPDSLNPLLVFLAADTDPDVEIKAAQMTMSFRANKGCWSILRKRWLCDEVPQL